MKRLAAIWCAMLALLLMSTAAQAQSKEELQERFKSRLAQIDELKKAGTIGETSEGYLDFVEGRSGKAGDLVNDENADRRKLYTIIAEETGATVDTVAKRNAKRNFERAKAGEFLKENGKWRKK